MAAEGLSLENPLFCTYAFYSCILILKMMFMSNLTSIKRVKTKTYISPEDTVFNGKVGQDEAVERIRRAHRNDLENIPIFLIVGLIYILTNPSYFLAATLIRIFTLARFIHTFVYAIFVFPQPSRFLAFMIGYFVTAYIAIHNVNYFLG